MEEKILIKSEFDKKTKSILLGTATALLLFVFCVSLALLTAKVEPYLWSRWPYTVNGYGAAFEFANGECIICFVFFVLHCLAFVAGIILLIIYGVNSKCELTVTEKNVIGKAIHGKEVVLPLHMISSYAKRKRLSTIVVATSSGFTKFTMIGNYVEICNVLSQKINERQEKTENKSKSNEASDDNYMDNLIKLKSLLDAGIITQEEFDTKKKQLLNQ